MSVFENENVKAKIEKFSEEIRSMVKIEMQFIGENQPNPMALLKEIIKLKNESIQLRIENFTMQCVLEVLWDKLNEDYDDSEDQVCDKIDNGIKELKEVKKQMKSKIIKVKGNGQIIKPGGAI